MVRRSTAEPPKNKKTKTKTKKRERGISNRRSKAKGIYSTFTGNFHIIRGDSSSSFREVRLRFRGIRLIPSPSPIDPHLYLTCEILNVPIEVNRSYFRCFRFSLSECSTLSNIVSAG